MIDRAAFTPAWWLPGPHLQTVWGRISRRRVLVELRREVVTTPDGDDLVLDHLDGSPGGSRFLLLHGLEGSSYSVYAQGFLSLVRNAGQCATVLNFRSCARDPTKLSRYLINRRARFYHSGETSDLDFVIDLLSSRQSGVSLLAFGASLGGNVLLKWLGEHRKQSRIAAAAVISVPYDLAAGAKHLETVLGKLYVRAFLRSLQKKAVSLAERFPDAANKIDLSRSRSASTFYEFDDAVTAPLHGFLGADDYYERSSAIHYLAQIDTPTLCLSAEDDPFTPPAVLRRVCEIAPSAVEVVTMPRGGHLGFVSGSPWKPDYWAERFVFEWLLRSSA